MPSSASAARRTPLRLSYNPAIVTIEPPTSVARHSCAWPGLRVETVQATDRVAVDYRYRAPCHLLIAAQRGHRPAGESAIEGLPTSSLQHFSGRLTFVPAGHAFHGWQNPRVLTEITYFYIDPHGPLLDEATAAGVALKPRLFFQDSDLWHVAGKLTNATLSCDASHRYGEAFGALLGHELVRVNEAPPRLSRGGLSGWQQKIVTDYIEANLAQAVRLADMAQLVRLSPFHFARAFKQSFGVPPHRYHVGRRIARAKDMLADREHSITAIARELGFAETSSFSSTFRRVTGASPSDFRRERG